MQASIFKIFLLPQVQQKEPIAIAHATDKPCRVQVNNLSAAPVSLGFSGQDVQGPQGIGQDIYQLFPAQESVFILAPKQTLFGVAGAPNARVCVAISEAYPWV